MIDRVEKSEVGRRECVRSILVRGDRLVCSYGGIIDTGDGDVRGGAGDAECGCAAVAGDIDLACLRAAGLVPGLERDGRRGAVSTVGNETEHINGAEQQCGVSSDDADVGPCAAVIDGILPDAGA